MRLSDYIRLGWDQLIRRKVVTLLCIIGIAIGSASIVVALSFGESINAYSENQFNRFLSLDEVIVSDGEPGGMSGAAGLSGAESSAKGERHNYIGSPILTEAKVDAIRQLPHVKKVATIDHIQQFFELRFEGRIGALYEIQITELPTLPDFGVQFAEGGPSSEPNMIVLNYGATMGLMEPIQDQDEEIFRFDEEAYEQLQTTVFPLYQQQIELYPVTYTNDGRKEVGTSFPVTVMGVIAKEDGIPDLWASWDKHAYVNPELGKRLKDAVADLQGLPSEPVSERVAYQSLKLKIDDPDNLEWIQEQVEKLNLSFQSNLHQREQMQNPMMVIRLVLGGAGMFVLLIASISIIVAMTMSTYQRRRQIGIMKVLGANLRQIRNMFVVESALLGLFGGVAGIVISYGVIFLINLAVSQLSEDEGFFFISVWILPLGLFFAIMTGVCSGIFPAVKASRTDALTAIKRD